MDIGKLPAATLSRLLARARTDPSVLVGPAYGEDAAAIRFGGSVLVAAADPITFATDRIGYYAVSVNANDIAVMGATPRYFLATILLPANCPECDAEDVFRQIEDACRAIGVVVVGGHTEITQAVDRIVVCGAMLGESGARGIIRSSGARAGDAVILVAGIAIEGSSILAREAAEGLIARGVDAMVIERAKGYLDDPGICILPYAQVAIEAGGVTFIHDPTEGGLATALRELAAASRCGLVIRREDITILPECEVICGALGIDPLGLIASGSLIITASPGSAERLIGAFDACAMPARVIGEVVGAERGLEFLGGGALPEFERDEIARYFDER